MREQSTPTPEPLAEDPILQAVKQSRADRAYQKAVAKAEELNAIADSYHRRSAVRERMNAALSKALHLDRRSRGEA